MTLHSSTLEPWITVATVEHTTTTTVIVGCGVCVVDDPHSTVGGTVDRISSGATGGRHAAWSAEVIGREAGDDPRH